MIDKFHQPDGNALRAFLEAHTNDPCGLAIRLAWLAGLTRGEIYELTWEQVDYEKQMLHLPDRDVPLCDDILTCLALWEKSFRTELPYVMVSRQKKHIMMQALSRLVRGAMEETGQPEVGFLDLRYDFIRRELQTHDWPYVLRVTGVSVTTWRASMSKLFAPGAEEMPQDAMTEEYLLWRVLQTNHSTPEGIALWLQWQMDLTVREIVALTWERVDFDARTLRLADRTAPMTRAVAEILSQERAKRSAEDDPHVILSPNARKPVNSARLCNMMRDVLIRGGIESKSLRRMRSGAKLREEKRKLLDFVRVRGCVTLRMAAEEFDISTDAAYRRLDALVADGAAAHISSGYYPAETVVPPERHRAAVLDYIASTGMVYCGDVAALLHIGKRPAQRLLADMVRNGLLQLDRKKKQYGVAKRENVTI